MQAHQDMVFSTAMRLLANRTQAEDIAQEVFLKAFERFDVLQQSERVSGWLRTVTTNLSLNQLTRQRRRWRLFSELSDNDAEPDELVGPDTEDLLDRLHQMQCQHHLDEALLTLPDHWRAPLVLYHFESMPYAQIAAQLRISLAKVKVDILRGRLALAKCLAALSKNEGMS